MISSKQLHPHASHMNRFSTVHVKPLSALGLNRLLHFASASLLGMFFPIFLFELFGFSLSTVLIWYIIDFGLKIPMVVIAAKLFSRFGLKISMLIGSLGGLLFYTSGYVLDHFSGANMYVWLGSAIFGLLLITCFYWSPFHVEFALFSKKGHRGREVGFFMGAERLIGLVSPLLGGWLVTYFSFQANFIGASVFLLLSLIPLAFIPRTPVTYEFGFFESFRKLFERKWRPVSISMMSFGAQDAVGVVIWPLFLYQIFKGEYLDIGSFAAVIIVISLALQVLVSRLVDRNKATRLLEVGTGLYSFGWIAKAAVNSIGGVFAASTFHSLGSILFRTPMDATMYEQAADAGHYIDEYTTLRELALTIGRTLMFIVLLVLTSLFSLQAAFICAAVISLGMTQLIHKVQV